MRFGSVPPAPPAGEAIQGEGFEPLDGCGDAAAFLEPAGHVEIRARYPQLEGALMMYIVHELEISGGAATRFLQGLSRDNGPTAYIFACRHCEAQPAYIDYL
jgi:hypothetical protein